MPKTYTATEVKEIVRECLGQKMEAETSMYSTSDIRTFSSTGLGLEVNKGRNSLRTLALERLEERLLSDKK